MATVTGLRLHPVQAADGTTKFEAEPFEYDEDAAVEAGARAALVSAGELDVPPHDCNEHAVPYHSNGPLGHGFECQICGCFLQAG